MPETPSTFMLCWTWMRTQPSPLSISRHRWSAEPLSSNCWTSALFGRRHVLHREHLAAVLVHDLGPAAAGVDEAPVVVGGAAVVELHHVGAVRGRHPVHAQHLEAVLVLDPLPRDRCGVPSTRHSRMPAETPALSWTARRSAVVLTAVNVTRLKVFVAVPEADAPLTGTQAPLALRYWTCHDCGVRHCPVPVSSNQ